MTVRTTTALCGGCEELNNVVPATFPPIPVDDDFEQDEPVCLKGRKHAVRRWRPPRRCPKRGRQTVHGERWLRRTSVKLVVDRERARGGVAGLLNER